MSLMILIVLTNSHAFSDTLKQEDMLASLFQQQCSNYVQLAHLIAMTTELRRVYFVGNFVSSDLARKFFTYNIVMRGMKDKGPVSTC